MCRVAGVWAFSCAVSAEGQVVEVASVPGEDNEVGWERSQERDMARMMRMADRVGRDGARMPRGALRPGS